MQQDGEDWGWRPEERDGEGAVQDQLLPGIVADPNPDPSDPYVFGPDPDWLVKVSKNSKKTLIPTALWLLFDFLSLKNDVNVPSKSNEQNFFV